MIEIDLNQPNWFESTKLIGIDFNEQKINLIWLEVTEIKNKKCSQF